MSDSSDADSQGTAAEPTVGAVADRPVVVRAGNEDFSVEAHGHFSQKDAEGYLPSPESDLLRVHVEETFSGPLDLLLFLIEKHALDILDIPIKVVVAEYMKAIDDMRDLNLDVAGEFLVMAAQLAHIKSKMLLPKEERPKEAAADSDPRADLVRRLLEYQRFKDAAARLDALPQLGRDVYARPLIPALYDGPVDEPVDPGLNLAEVDPIDLIRLFDGILKRQKKHVVHEILVERISVGARISELIDIFNGDREITSFTFADVVDRFGPRTKRGVIVCFLSVLEMARIRLVRLVQDPDTLAISVLPVHANLIGEDDDAGLSEQLKSVDEFDGAPEAESP